MYAVGISGCFYFRFTPSGPLIIHFPPHAAEIDVDCMPKTRCFDIIILELYNDNIIVNKNPPPVCEKCQTELSVIHIVQECMKYHGMRTYLYICIYHLMWKKRKQRHLNSQTLNQNTVPTLYKSNTVISLRIAINCIFYFYAFLLICTLIL